ncbi:hypothetical protein BS643_13915 [Pseudomonas protegens]|nr:hypothetical protein BS644_18485 [Pseudomonas protegens]OKK46628.1 hypothetical protein BS643_13915 [Pseudomonas protegens]OKK61627.1 hypothetical protein BS645_09340 [Pseudomonas protegens]OKK66162.1 hypothetical protein BS646_19995 [Pseudomonas protegens]
MPGASSDPCNERCSRCRACEAARRSAGPCLTVSRQASCGLTSASIASSECRPARSQPAALATGDASGGGRFRRPENIFKKMLRSLPATYV